MGVMLSLLLLSSCAQENLPIAEALPPRSWFGWSSCWAGDVDGDGKVDLATSDFAYRGNGAADGSGIVAILSGKDGSLLRVLRRQPGDAAFGRCLAAIGVHGGSDDQALAISGLRHASGEALGFVRIVSVRTGETLAELEETDGGESFGEKLATGPDANGDGVPDYAVGAPSSAGRCYLYSGKDHRLLQKWECGGPGVLALVGDMDGDGGADVAIGNPGVRDHRENLSAVELYSGATGERIRVLREPKRLRDFGSAVVDVGDISGDGRNELAIGAPWKGYANQVNKHAFRQWLESENERRSGAVYLFSGADGALLRVIDDPEPIREGVQWTNGGPVGDAFGERLAFVKDRDAQQAALLIADHEFGMNGVVHCFGIPGAQHRWSVEGDPSPGFGGDFHFGYTVYSDEAASGEPLFVVSTTNPWGGLDPRIRVLHALDGAERLRAHSSDILPRIE